MVNARGRVPVRALKHEEHRALNDVADLLADSAHSGNASTPLDEKPVSWWMTLKCTSVGLMSTTMSMPFVSLGSP